MLFCPCPALGAEFTGLPEAPGYATIGTLYGPRLTTIGTVIRKAADGDPTTGALIPLFPLCHLVAPFIPL